MTVITYFDIFQKERKTPHRQKNLVNKQVRSTELYSSQCQRQSKSQRGCAGTSPQIIIKK